MAVKIKNTIKPRNVAVLELWVNPLFRPKKCKSVDQKNAQRDKWDRNAKHKGRVHSDPYSFRKVA